MGKEAEVVYLDDARPHPGLALKLLSGSSANAHLSAQSLLAFKTNTRDESITDRMSRDVKFFR